MITNLLGKSDLAVPTIALGMMRVAQLTVTELDRLVNTALDHGINMFDHADIYGKGMSEIQFGKVLQNNPSLRNKVILQSKCAIRQNQYDWSKEYILEAVDGILKRLQTDHLDVLLLHRPDTLMEPEEVGAAFDQLVDSGKVRYFGVSNCNSGQIELLQASLKQPLLVNQLQFGPAHSGIVDSGIHFNLGSLPGSASTDGILEYCRLKKITIQTWSPLQYGFFEGTILGSEKYPKLNEVLNRIAAEQGTCPGAVALAWILRHPAHMQAIVGTTNPKHLEELVSAVNVTLSRTEWYEIYRAAGNELP